MPDTPESILVSVSDTPFDSVTGNFPRGWLALPARILGTGFCPRTCCFLWVIGFSFRPTNVPINPLRCQLHFSLSFKSCEDELVFASSIVSIIHSSHENTRKEKPVKSMTYARCLISHQKNQVSPPERAKLTRTDPDSLSHQSRLF